MHTVRSKMRKITRNWSSFSIQRLTGKERSNIRRIYYGIKKVRILLIARHMQTLIENYIIFYYYIWLQLRACWRIIIWLWAHLLLFTLLMMSPVYYIFCIDFNTLRINSVTDICTISSHLYILFIWNINVLASCWYATPQF